MIDWEQKRAACPTCKGHAYVVKVTLADLCPDCRPITDADWDAFLLWSLKAHPYQIEIKP